jgi:pimeloyl-ACP methyl ester carboxylesterase
MSDLGARLDEFLREHPKRSAAFGSTEGSYRPSGRGPEGLIVLPGALGGAEAIAPPLLSELAQDYRLLFVEYPAVSDLDDVLTGLSDMLSREGIAGTALLGGSFGGLVAQAFLLWFPERTTRVVLSGTGPPDPRRASRNERWLPLLRLLPMGGVRSLLRLGVRKLLKRVSRDRELWDRIYSQAIDGLTRERLLALYRVAIDFDRRCSGRTTLLGSWSGEMLLIEGSEDRLAGKRSREALEAAYPRARTVTLHGASHAMALERPEEWRDAVLGFLKAG